MHAMRQAAAGVTKVVVGLVAALAGLATPAYTLYRWRERGGSLWFGVVVGVVLVLAAGLGDVLVYALDPAEDRRMTRSLEKVAIGGLTAGVVALAVVAAIMFGVSFFVGR